MPCARNLGGSLVAALLLVACGRGGPDSAAPAPPVTTPAGPRAAFIPTQAQLDAYLAEGPDPSLRRIAAADYWLHFKLMEISGIEKEIGGEDKAIAALKSLGEAYEREVRGVAADAPKLLPATFTGEGMSAGFLGMGAGSFVGMIGGGTIGGMVSTMSDAQIAELNSRGGIKSSNSHGSFEFQAGKDGSMTQSMEFEMNSDGVNGKVKLNSRMQSCPDADGRVTVDIKVDSQMSVTDKPGTGGRVQSEFHYERYVDDDAHLIDTADGAASNLHVRMGGYENFESQSVDITLGNARGGAEIFENHGEQGYSIFRPDEVTRTQKLLQATQLLQTLMAEAMLRGMGTAEGSPWESGRCIDLKVTSDPAKRTGLRPSTAFDIQAMPRVKSDGSPAKGTVTATLTGGSSLQPATGKVRADAKYGYTGPAKKQETASIAFESRSKRGVGKASLDFDTKGSRGYRIEGGAKELHFKGQVCDLANPFSIRSDNPMNDVTMQFVPSSDTKGNYSYKGTMSGIEKGEKFTFPVHGTGTYDVKAADGVASGIAARGPGTVETPYGPLSGNGDESYTLTPLGEEPCEG